MTKFARFLPIIFSVVFATSCQTYTSKNSSMRDQLYSGDIHSALKTLDSSDLATEDRSFALFHMEKGMLLYLNHQYESAVNFWVRADKKLDDLYTTSISRTATSFVINDSMSDYTGEAHERVLLPIFSSMAFFANNNINNAQVMVRRAYNVTSALQSENKGNNTFKYDAFSHYFAGAVHESKNDWDNAIVEYRLALDNLNKSESSMLEKNIPAKTEIIQSLGRLAEYRNRNDILNYIQKETPGIKWIKQENLLKKGELYIIYECGKSPIKVPEDIVLPTGKTVVRISFPKYKSLNYSSRKADVYVNNKFQQRTVLMEDIGKMAQQALNDRRIRDLAKMAARVVAKDVVARKLNDDNPFAGLAANIFNVATEVADTRSWTTLPDTIQFARVPIEAQKENEVELKPEFGLSEKLTVNLKPGEKKLIRFRTYN